MATEIPNGGYESIRSLVKSADTAPSQWDYIALVDDTGTEVYRVSITGDANASWSEEDQDGDTNNETMVATLTITGQDLQDAGNTLPVTVEESELYDASGSSTVLSEDTFPSATLESSSDELTVEHKVEIPQVA